MEETPYTRSTLFAAADGDERRPSHWLSVVVGALITAAFLFGFVATLSLVIVGHVEHWLLEPLFARNVAASCAIGSLAASPLRHRPWVCMLVCAGVGLAVLMGGSFVYSWLAH